MYRQTATRKAKTGNGPGSASDTGQTQEQQIPEWKNDWMGAWTRGSPLFASGASEMENDNNSRQTRSYSPWSPGTPDYWTVSETPESDHSGYTKSPANYTRHENRIRSAQEEHDQFGYSNWDTRDGPLRDRIRRDYENSNDRRSMGQSSPWSPQIDRATGTPENVSQMLFHRNNYDSHTATNITVGPEHLPFSRDGRDQHSDNVQTESRNEEQPQWWLYSPRSPDYTPTRTPEREINNDGLQMTPYSPTPGTPSSISSFGTPENVADSPPRQRSYSLTTNVKHEISSTGPEATRQPIYIPRSPSPANSVVDLKRRKHRKRKHSHHHHHHRGHSKSHKKHKRARKDSESDVWVEKEGTQEAVASKDNVKTPLSIWNSGQCPPKKVVSFLDGAPRQSAFPRGAVDSEKRERERNTPPWRRTGNSSATTTNWNRGQRPKAVATKVATPPREKAFPRGAGEAEKRNTPPWRRTENNWRNSNTNRRGRGGGTGRWNVDKNNLSRYIPLFSPHRVSLSHSRSTERSKGSNKTSIVKPPKPADHSDRRSYSRSPRSTNSTSNWNRGQRPKPVTKFATAPRERAFQRGARDTEKKDQQRNTPPWRRPENNWRNSITNRRGRGGGTGRWGVERDRQNIRYMGSNKNSNLEPPKPTDHIERRSYSRSPRSPSP